MLIASQNNLTARNSRPNRIRQLARSAMSCLLPRCLFTVRGPASNRSIYLTFDDGPHPEFTPRILDVLKERNILATFFVLGRHAEEHPDLVLRIASEGHTVGNHSFSHDPPWTISASKLGAEINRTAALVEKITGKKPVLFRPPNGSLTAAKILQAWRFGQRIIMWSYDPRDYSSSSPLALQSWIKSHPVTAGDIILLHDTSPYTAEMLPVFIEQVQCANIDFSLP